MDTEIKFIAFYISPQGGIEWLCEHDELAASQAQLDAFVKANVDIEAGWIVETVGRNYSNT